MLALAWMFNIVERGSAAYSRIRSLLQEAPAVVDGTTPLPAGRATLEAHINDFHYPENSHAALTTVTFSLQPGQMLGLCGPTGSGKSTLLSLLQRQFDVTDGDVSYHGLSLKEIQLDDWRARLAVVVRRLSCSQTLSRRTLRSEGLMPRRKRLKKPRVSPAFMMTFCDCLRDMKLKSASAASCYRVVRSSVFRLRAHCSSKPKF